jgi:hypothetical protein
LRIESLRNILDDENQKDNCVVPRYIWQRWIEEQETEVLLVEIIQKNIRHVLCVDSYHTMEHDKIYISQRYISDLDLDDVVQVRVLDILPPIATKIVLEPLDIDSQGFDIASAVSEYLSHWNVLKSGTILTVNATEVEGYKLDIYVKATEPEDIVLLRGEVPLEIESNDEIREPLPHSPTHHPPTHRPPTPIPQENEILEDFIDMIGGVQLPQQQPAEKKFIPFQGSGRRLGF